MSNSFLYRMPAGIAGDVTRAEHADVEPGLFDANYPCLAFGIVVKLSSGLYRPIASGDTLATTAKGFLVRSFPISEPYGTSVAQEALGYGVPNTTLAANVLKRGYMTVKVTANGATALANIVKGDQVYCRKTAAIAPALGSVGDLEAGSATGNEAVPSAFFMGPADSNGFVEIEYNI